MKQSNIIFYGDSVLYGKNIDFCLRWPYLLENKLCKTYNLNVKFINNADCNFNTNLAMFHLDKFISNDNKPDIFLLQYGYKDYVDEIIVENFRINIKNMIKKIKKTGTKEIIILTTHNKIGYLKEYNEKLREIAKEENCKFIDMEKYFLQMTDKEVISSLQEDFIHLNLNGHILYSNIMEYELINSIKKL